MDGGSWIAREAKVVGLVETPGHLVIAGRLEGSVRAGGDVTVERGAVAVAEVRAWRVRVEGVVIGDVIAREAIEVAAGARVVGDLCAPSIELEAGAELEGKIDRRLPAADERPGAGEPASGVMRATQPIRRPARPAPTVPPPPGAPRAPADAVTLSGMPITADPPDARPVPAAPKPDGRARMVKKRSDPPEEP
jgi:cytoskeletal protein CcmA (bactofilin family)